ncbi:MAG: hypothetical protein H6729_11020 [Deltaproteobacteria bacterium]|nr:hypothetical protein [Deltaproteobacteria bacterium]
MLTQAGHAVRTYNTHTWVNQKWHPRSPAGQSWGPDARGCGIIEIGSTGDGRFWTDSTLMRVADATGRLRPGWTMEVDRPPPRKSKAEHQRFVERALESALADATTMPSALGIITGLSSAPREPPHPQHQTRARTSSTRLRR